MRYSLYKIEVLDRQPLPAVVAAFNKQNHSQFCSNANHSACSAVWCKCGCHDSKPAAKVDRPLKASKACKKGHHVRCSKLNMCGCNCHTKTTTYKQIYTACVIGDHSVCGMKHKCGCYCHSPNYVDVSCAQGKHQFCATDDVCTCECHVIRPMKVTKECALDEHLLCDKEMDKDVLCDCDCHVRARIVRGFNGDWD